VGQSAFDDPTKQAKSVAGAPVNAGGRAVGKGGLALAVCSIGVNCGCSCSLPFAERTL
jgi:hypothetical protein